MRRLFLLAVLLASLALSSCGTPPAAGISVSAALAIVAKYNVNNTRANNTLDVSLQNANEESSAAVIDDADYAQSRLLGQSAEGGTQSPRPVWKVTVYPGPASGTRSFLALIRTITPAHVPPQLFEFVKDSSSEPYRVRYEVPLGTTSVHENIPSFALDGGVLVPSPGPDAPLEALAGYWQSLTSNGSSFAPGPFTTGQRSSERQVAASLDGLGSSSVASSLDAAFPVVSYPLASGGTLVFGTLKTTYTIISTSAIRFDQQQDRAQFSPFLAPGAYANVTWTQLDQVAVVVPSSGPMAVIGDYNGIISASGSRTGNATGGTSPSPSQTPATV